MKSFMAEMITSLFWTPCKPPLPDLRASWGQQGFAIICEIANFQRRPTSSPGGNLLLLWFDKPIEAQVCVGRHLNYMLGNKSNPA